jgi:hypothetical protein
MWGLWLMWCGTSPSQHVDSFWGWFCHGPILSPTSCKRNNGRCTKRGTGDLYHPLTQCVPEDMNQHCTKSSLEWHENHLLGSIICLNTRNQDYHFDQQLRKHIMSFKPLNVPTGKRIVWAHMCKPVLSLLGNLMEKWPSFWVWGIYYQSEWDGRHNRAAETAIMCTTSGKGKCHPDHLWMWGNLYEGTDNYTATIDSIAIHASNIMQHYGEGQTD